ncbi:MAG TPA: polysaccharide biosynthesis tyrosine autokinase, partial [Opitutaceae bacterium]
KTLRDYVIILRERLWVALPLALLAAIGLGYYQARQVPLYSSTATMRFEKPEKIVLNQAVVDPSITSEIDLNTNLQVLNSARLRTRVVESLTPEEIRILQRPYVAALKPGEQPPPAGALLGNLSIQSIRNSFLISITITHRDPEAAALVANRFVDQFMVDLLDNVSGKNEVAVDILGRRAEQLRRESSAAEQRLQDYMRQHNLVSLDNSTNIIQARLNAVNDALQRARLERLGIEQLSNQVESHRKEGRNLIEISYIASHGTIPAIRTQLDELTRNQAVLGERYLERHPKMIDVANAIAAAKHQLDSAVALAVADLAASLEKARANESSLEREFAENEKEQLRLRDLSVDFRTLQDQAAVAKSNYAQILDRLSQTNTARNIEKIPVRPLDAAVPAGAPFAPNLGRIVRTSAGLFVFVFVGVALALSVIDDRIKSAWDVESFIGTSLLGIIPDLSELKDADRHSLVLHNKQAPGTESFLSVYSSVKIHSKLDFPKSILVTSTIPGEGKTLISSNLAGSFARHGKTTLLVDCDLRRPMLHRHFNQANNAGLITWFDNGASLEGSLRDNPHLGIVKLGENFSLLCSGGRSKTPTELLESPVFGQLVERLKKEYELVVIDSPPLGAVTDSLLIAERTDEVIYVCRFNRAFRKHIKLYIKALRSGKNEVLGVVLNGLSPRRIEYYSNYRYYRSYKKYYGAQA